MDRLRRGDALIPAYGRRPLLLALAFHCAVYWGAKYVSAGWLHTDMTTALDRAVPLLPWTVVIYVLAYLFWAANYILAVRQDQETAFRLLAADGLAKSVCLVIFLLLPTTNIRPEIPAGAPFGWALALLYAADDPSGLFPSIHCLTSWLCWAAIRGKKTVPAWYRTFSLLFALAVVLSTMTTKQHVLADAAGGLILGEACWQTAGHTGLAARYRRIWTRKSVAR